MLAILAVVYFRRLNPVWIVIVPVIGGIAVGVCFMIAGQRADHAAICVETPTAESDVSPAVGLRPTSVVLLYDSAIARFQT